MKFRKKPVVIDAVQLRWTTWNEVCDFLGEAFKRHNPDGAKNIPMSESSDSCGEEGQGISLNVMTTHGEIAVVRHGDWIIPDSKPGTFYPCKPDVFENTYEPYTPEDIPEESKEWPDSSTIAKTVYYPTIGTLKIYFRSGRVYNYFQFPESAWVDLKETDSIGKFFNTRIKEKYQSEGVI